MVHPKPALHSQEPKQVSSIVINTWQKVDKKKKPLRSQESINEEKLVGEIMVTAWEKAGKLKIQTEKLRQKAEDNRKKPKLHSQNSILEEKFVQNIVSKAWDNIHHEDKLHNICENAMEHESSFDGSDSEGETPKATAQAEARQSRTIEDANEQNKNKTRRSRANRKCSKDMTSSKSKPTYVDQNRSPFKDVNSNVIHH